MPRYVSLDIETTGLNIETCDLLEVGAVIDDFVTPLNELPTFHTYVYQKFFTGEAFALQMNAEILRRIAVRHEPSKYQYRAPNEVCEALGDWLIMKGFGGQKVVFAGKNAAGFDLPFLDKYGLNRRILRCHRVLDIGSMYYDPSIDEEPPSLQECLRRAGIEKSVSHVAVDDAMDVVQLIRHHFRG